MTLSSKLVFLALLVPGLMLADTCNPGDYCYTLTFPGFTVSPLAEDTSTQWSASFVTVGPEMYNLGAGDFLSFTPTITAPSGWTLGNYGLTSYGTDGAAFVQFQNNTDSSEMVTYEFFATDAFWATTGGPFTLGSTTDSSATSGAFINNGGIVGTLDAATCSDCTVTIASGTAAPVPEPASVGLLALVVAGISFQLFRRKVRRESF